MKKIKVVFVAETLIENYDGAVRTMFQIIRRIPGQEFEFLFICGAATDNALPGEVLKVPTTMLPFNANYSVAIPYFIQSKITEKLKSFEPDIVHIATPSPLGHFALNFAKENHIPTIAIYHTHFLSYVDFYLRKVPFLIEPIKEKFIQYTRSFYENCQITLIPTQNMIDEFIRYNIDTTNMKLWPRGIDKQLFNPSKKDKQFLSTIVKNKHPNLLFASRLVWEKNLETLSRIYSYSKTKNKQYNFIIAGDGVAREELEELMPEAYFLGNMSHERLATLYASCDIFVFPSITETYGNVVIEAMASGLPCVIANGGGSAAFIQHGHNGFKCDAVNENEYVEFIEIILNNEKLKQQFIQRSLDFVQPLDWDSLAKTYFDELRNLALKEEMVLGIGF